MGRPPSCFCYCDPVTSAGRASGSGISAAFPTGCCRHRVAPMPARLWVTISDLSSVVSGLPGHLANPAPHIPGDGCASLDGLTFSLVVNDYADDEPTGPQTWGYRVPWYEGSISFGASTLTMWVWCTDSAIRQDPNSPVNFFSPGGWHFGIRLTFFDVRLNTEINNGTVFPNFCPLSGQCTYPTVGEDTGIQWFLGSGRSGYFLSNQGQFYIKVVARNEVFPTCFTGTVGSAYGMPQSLFDQVAPTFPDSSCAPLRFWFCVAAVVSYWSLVHDELLRGLISACHYPDPYGLPYAGCYGPGTYPEGSPCYPLLPSHWAALGFDISE